MILSGELAPGERVTEQGLAQQLGISRTPIRHILPNLATQGLLEPVGKRGFAVKSFSETECWEADPSCRRQLRDSCMQKCESLGDVGRAPKILVR